MLNNEYMSKLESLLSKVPEKDRREMLYDYEEHFQVGMTNGKSQADLIAELGDPHVIARDLLSDYHVGRVEKVQTTSKTRAIIETISLVFFNLIFVVGPLGGIFGAFIALCGVSLGLSVMPFAILGSYFLGYSYESFAVNFFASLTVLSLGLLMGIGMMAIGKVFYRLFVSYIKFNFKIVKGGKAA
ncbi:MULTISPECIES: DUF1700 domain-containing protein [unclassified Bacillus (in: firmicutes)]|uniref:HAAS signaling domain-containing protein n=1 Tax=unclassified Bacillus (in: firmicutes) TaxID=185979 RepID=UPI0008E48922|nr:MULTISPECIES: DUF1700 domain-containing protein [unclassified Bacillus (in: firmicutes)]SFB24089.1 Uncharacterized membrane protein [Bacillus sp. UNCCL13]SFQ91324.1 Uncharacterized membrane protein [Bacillus sp. cl95]